MKFSFWWNILDIVRTSCKGIQNFKFQHFQNSLHPNLQCTLRQSIIYDGNFFLQVLNQVITFKERMLNPTSTCAQSIMHVVLVTDKMANIS